MALNRASFYPGRFDAVTAAHPQGAFKNRSAPAAGDGSYIEKNWANDWDGFFSSLLDGAALSPNGLVDEVGASQYYDALIALTSDPETIRDIVAAMLQQGDGVLLSEDDPGDTLTIALDQEFTRDLVATFAQAGAGITITHDDPGNTLTFAADDEYFYDLVADSVQNGTGLSKSVSDAGNTVTLSLNDEYVRDMMADTFVAGDGISIVESDAANTFTFVNTKPGRLRQILSSTTSSTITTTASIPYDNTVPTSGQGAQVLSRSITLAESNNNVIVDVSIPNVGVQNVGEVVVFALFRNTTCIMAGAIKGSANSEPVGSGVQFHINDAPGTTGVTYSVRMGIGIGSGQVKVNATGSADKFSTAGVATITLVEVDD